MTARRNDPTGAAAAAKATLRHRLLGARHALTPAARADRDAALTAEAVRVVTAVGAAGEPGAGTLLVCAYLPVGTEPGGPGFADALAATGAEVLLPVVPDRAGPLDWARHDGRVVAGPFGLREPAGPRRGPDVIAGAALVFVPALAVDREGVRLGRGGGFYDRTLARATGMVVAVLGAAELVERLPAQPHDRPVTAVLLPDAGLITLGKTG